MNQQLEKTFAREVVQRLVDAGFEALWAGGCVRDELLGLVPADYDIATSARPEQVRKIFPRTVAVGASFGVIEVIGPLHPNGKPIMIQVATFRADLGYTDGRRPDAIRYCSAQEDALRRDFTINGMFFDPIANKLVDYVEGQIDLKSKVLRAIGDANVRFAEDRLRMLRAARLVPRFDLTLDETTKAAILANASAIGTVSPERIADELRKIFQHTSREVGISLFIELGLARQIFPEVFSTETVGMYSELLAILRHLPKVSSFPLVLASLLQKLSGKQAEETCRRFKMSNVEIEATRSLVQYKDSLLHPDQLRLCQLKKILVMPMIDDLLSLMSANCLSLGQGTNAVEYCLGKLAEWPREILDPMPLVGGEDLKVLGLKPGPKFKQILDLIRDEQLDGVLKIRAHGLLRAQELSKLL
ncbi:MAG: CCA tRNA nucleotidyltransferase [Gemmataceae bacterium]|nr:CCA tRNA nucleotidyltransferase [Gemmataceae bacterium]